MSYRRATDPTWNSWKWTTIGMAVIFSTALIAGSGAESLLLAA